MLERELAAAVALAEEAGAEVMRQRSKAKETARAKAGGDPVTAADLAANEIVLRGLAKAFPGEAILSEESPSDPVRLSRDRVWIVDPIDGTREFIAGTDDFAVQIGLAIAGVAALGVVYQVARDRLFIGLPGEGAWIEAPAQPGRARRALVTSAETDPHRMRMTLSRWHRTRKHEEIAKAVRPAALLPAGSIGVKMGLIAIGEADLYLHPSRGTAEWDTCAPSAILTGAGGAVTDLFGAPLRYNRATPVHPSGLACSNGRAHAAILRTIDPVVRRLGYAP